MLACGFFSFIYLYFFSSLAPPLRSDLVLDDFFLSPRCFTFSMLFLFTFLIYAFYFKIKNVFSFRFPSGCTVVFVFNFRLRVNHDRCAVCPSFETMLFFL